jgi:biopolymer transport protein ExbB/TolQ
MQAIAEFIQKGGPFMYVNLCSAAFTLGLIVERAVYYFMANRVNAKALLEQIQKLVGANNITRAVKLCSASSAPVARVGKAGLTRFHKGEIAITTAIEESMADLAPEIKKRVSALWSVANIATLFGLIGTIFGLIKTFASLGTASPADRARLLSDGIAEAMNNTALGLSIAVTCMVAHLFLSGTAKTLQGNLDTFGLKLENCLIEESRKWENQQGAVGAAPPAEAPR